MSTASKARNRLFLIFFTGILAGPFSIGFITKTASIRADLMVFASMFFISANFAFAHKQHASPKVTTESLAT